MTNKRMRGGALEGSVTESRLVPGFDRSRDVLYAIVNQDPADGGTDKASYNPVVSTPDFAEGFGNNPDYPKAGLFTLNGLAVDESQFFCRWVRNSELCSVDVTAQAFSGVNSLTVHQQPDVTRNFNLLSLQVVNSNGAPLALFPITDLSGVGSAYYFSSYIWSMISGELNFEFSVAF